MKVVIDIDGTICTAQNRDYINAVPDTEVINKINQIYDDGIEICLYTARGMVSCNGDLEKIENKNRKILEQWLLKNNVKYNELIFGKPLGDLYIDDKALNVEDFKELSFKAFNGGSGLSTYKMGSYVRKELASEEKVFEYFSWMNEAKGYCLYPKFISAVYNVIHYKYIEGKNLNEVFTKEKLYKLIQIIENFKNRKYTTFDLNYHINNLKKNQGLSDLLDKKIDFCVKKLNQHQNILLINASLSHGDCILSNIIYNNDYYFIDTQFNKEASSYLLDFAKLRMSLDNYEYIFNISNQKLDKKYKQILDDYLQKEKIYDTIILLEYMYILRLYRYKKQEDKDKVFQMLQNIEKEQQWIIK